MDLVNSVLLAVVTSATTVALLSFVVRYYLKRAVDLRFKPLEDKLQLEFEERRRLNEALLEQRIGIYPEILEITYRLRKMLEQGLEQPSASLWHDDIAALCHHLTENLFRWRAFVPDDVFRDLHEFKRLCQDVTLHLDVLTRKENSSDKAAYQERLPELRARIERAQQLYPAIQNALSFNPDRG
ncbi:hypothetical protein [Woeseia oceani]|uniref:Uncharacterized protein n=1 Tax=Woeseia oceani TaxID=1548547 RepID=A0A193LCH4_9GAMM|nr:hypothetical protein [Woeseia oceani]ANO50168.1 hypothetical protein BA177_02080 [Woeseia oceani]